MFLKSYFGVSLRFYETIWSLKLIKVVKRVWATAIWFSPPFGRVIPIKLYQNFKRWMLSHHLERKQSQYSNFILFLTREVHSLYKQSIPTRTNAHENPTYLNVQKINNGEYGKQRKLKIESIEISYRHICSGQTGRLQAAPARKDVDKIIKRQNNPWSHLTMCGTLVMLVRQSINFKTNWINVESHHYTL